MYCNVWLTYPVHALETRNRASAGQEYPSGGPQQQNIDLWKIAAPSIDTLALIFTRMIFRSFILLSRPMPAPDNPSLSRRQDLAKTTLALTSSTLWATEPSASPRLVSITPAGHISKTARCLSGSLKTLRSSHQCSNRSPHGTSRANFRPSLKRRVFLVKCYISTASMLLSPSAILSATANSPRNSDLQGRAMVAQTRAPGIRGHRF